MPYEQQVGSDLSDGQFLKTPGWYHLFVTELIDPPTKDDGTLLDWAAFKVRCEVLAGTVEGMEGKQIDITPSIPKPSDKDGGNFRRKVIDRLALALGVISEADKGKPYRIEKANVEKRHFMAHLDFRENQDGSQGKFLEVVGTAAYHVDDPAMKNMPKSEVAMNLPAAWRRIGSGQKPAASQANGNGAATAKAASNAAPFDPSSL